MQKQNKKKEQTWFEKIRDDTNLSSDAMDTRILISVIRHCVMVRESRGEKKEAPLAQRRRRNLRLKETQTQRSEKYNKKRERRRNRILVYEKWREKKKKSDDIYSRGGRALSVALVLYKILLL